MEDLFSAVARAKSAADCETMLREASDSLSERSRDVQLVDLGLQLGFFEACQHLPLGHLVAFADQDFGQASRDARLHDRLVDGLRRAGEAHGIDQAARADRMKLDRDQLDDLASRFGVLGGRGRGLGRDATAALPGNASGRQGDGCNCGDDNDCAAGTHGRSPLKMKSR